MNRWKTSIAGAALLAVGLPWLVPSPAAAGRLDAPPGMFDTPRRQQIIRVLPPAWLDDAPQEARPAAKPGDPVPVVRIESPEYYTFNAEPLVPVNFATLVSMSDTASTDPQLGGTVFRESLTGLSGYRLPAERGIGQALVDYYKAAPDFLWVSGDGPNERARAAMAVLADAGSYGLDPDDYLVAPPASVPDAASGLDRRAELIRFEMALSARALRYLRDARGGRLDPNQLSGYHDLPVKPFDGKAELARLMRAQDTRLAMEAAHPQMPEYAALRRELAALDGAARALPVSVDPKLLVNPGGNDPELPQVMQLIARDLPAGDPDATAIAQFGNGTDYVPELVSVVKGAQARAGLRADGVIGPRTVKALIGESPAEKIDKVKLAMEQLRWRPRMRGDTRVFINEAAFDVTYTENGAEKLSMRAVVGKKTNQTSYFYDTIEQVDFNPYWGVPQSILVNEMLPRLRRDPGYLDRAGYEVTDAKGRQVPSSSVDWNSYGSKIPFNVRQTPSEANALGELKILFPNEHAIYMHDTPEKSLFKRDVRAFSHGCVRLEHPREMAAAVLGKDVNYVAEKLAKGHSVEKTRAIPVYVAYFTAWPDAAGRVSYHDDVYDRDAHLVEALEKVESSRLAGS